MVREESFSLAFTKALAGHDLKESSRLAVEVVVQKMALLLLLLCSTRVSETNRDVFS